MGAVLQLVGPLGLERLEEREARTLPEFTPKGAPLSELCRWFRDEFASPLAPATRTNYERTIVLALEGSPGRRGKGPIGALPEYPSPRDVTRWLSDMKAGGYLDSTINLRRTDLVHLYEAGNRCAISHGNPAMVLPWLKTVPKRAPLIDVRGTWSFLRAALGGPGGKMTRELAFVAVLRFTGLRKGEALGLEWRHLDTKERRVHVDQQRRKANSRTVTRRLKSEAARRKVPMRAELLDVLEELRREVGTEPHEIRSGLGGGKRATTSLVFPFSTSHLAKLMKVLRGIDPEGFPQGDAWHVFRHTVAVELWRAEKSEAYIQEWLGHASLEKTATYLRSLDGRRIAPESVDAIDPDYRPKKKRAPRVNKNKGAASDDVAPPEVPVAAGTPAVPPEAQPVKEEPQMRNPEKNETTTATAPARQLRKLGAQAHEEQSFSAMIGRAVVLFADEITRKAEELERTDVESAAVVRKYAGLIVDVIEGRRTPAEASAASAGDLRSALKEKSAALAALERMTGSYRLASDERDAWQTLCNSRSSRIEDLETERNVVRLVLSPMPPQTLVERAEELVMQARAGRVHLNCRVRDSDIELVAGALGRLSEEQAAEARESISAAVEGVTQ